MTNDLAWYHSLCRDVLETLGTPDGIQWIAGHKEIARRNMRELQGIWNVEKKAAIDAKQRQDFTRALKPCPDYWPMDNLRPEERDTTVEKLYLMGYSISDARRSAPVLDEAAEHPGITIQDLLSLLRKIEIPEHWREILDKL